MVPDLRETLTAKPRRSIGRVFLRRIARFGFLWVACLLLISLMAFAEALVFWLRWPHSANRSWPHRVSIGDFAVSPNGEWGVSCISYPGKDSPILSDVVLHDLRWQNPIPLRIAHDHPRCVAVSPASDDLAIVCSDGSIRIGSGLADYEASLSVAHGRLQPFTQTSDDLYRAAFSPDGRVLAAAGRRFIHVWRWPGGELLHQRPLDEFAAHYLSFSDDSEHLLSAGSRGKARLGNVYTGATVKTIPPGDDSVVNAALSPDGELVALLLRDAGLRVQRLATDEELWRDTRPRCCSCSMAYSPDGRFLAVTASNSGTRVVVCEAASGQTVCKLCGHNAPITQLAFAPGGLLYSSDSWGVIRSWNIEERREEWSFSTLDWGSKNRVFREAPENLD